ncbi:hypothetical protein FRB94_000511 [Tulasnella sp. JGI-2019a]|nr:hypothetical protein FRB94_000511 [Tulasnella sp. JGI-2019a]
MRRFEKRGTEAPMDFEYERERNNVGPWSSQTFATTSPLKANNRAGGSVRPILPFTPPPYTPAGPQGFNTNRGHSIPFTPPPTSSPAPSSSYWDLPGSFSPQKASTSIALPEIQDVIMSPAGRDEDDAYGASPTKSEADRPARSRRNPEKLGGKTTKTPKSSSSPRKGRGKKGSRDEDEWLPDDEDESSSNQSPKKPQRRQKYSTSSSDGGDELDAHGSLSASNYYNVHLPSPIPPSIHVSNELTGYLTFGFKLILLLTSLLIGFSFIMAVKQDVDARVLEYSSELLHDIALCSQLYLTNKCHPDTRVPVVEQLCQDWERCMNKDPKVVGRVRVWAETLGEMFNSFVEPIAWKTLAFTVITLFSMTFATWGIFRLFGSWQHQHSTSPAPSQMPLLHNPPFPLMLQSPSSTRTPRRSPRPAIDAVQDGSLQQQEWLNRAWSQEPQQIQTRSSSRRV